MGHKYKNTLEWATIEDHKNINELQTNIPERMDLVPANAILAVSQVLAEGANRYGENNWKQIDIDSHINHALTHLYKYLSHDLSDNHLTNATCRLLFALSLRREMDEEDEYLVSKFAREKIDV